MPYLAAAADLFTTDQMSYVIYPGVRESLSPAGGQPQRFYGLLRRPRKAGWTWTMTRTADFDWPREVVAYAPLVRESDSVRFFVDDPADLGGQADLPAWTGEALAAILAHQSLPVNWDSYGGLPLSDRHARIAWRFLELVMGDELPLPDFVPLPDGGLQLEWDANGAQLSFTSEDGTMPTLWLSEHGESREISGDEVLDVLDRFRTRMHHA